MDTNLCPFCHKKFVRYEYLALHIERRHSEGSSGFIAYDDQSGPGEDSEGEIRTSRLERSKGLWTPQTEWEREMTGAVASASTKGSMRDQRTRGSPALIWPPVYDRSSSPASQSTVSSSALRESLQQERTSRTTNAQNGKSTVHEERGMVRLTPTSSVTEREEDRSDSFRTSLPILPASAILSSKSTSLPPAIRVQSNIDDGSSDEEIGNTSIFVNCPLDECGEPVPAHEINVHIERHQAEQLILDDDLSSPTSTQAATRASILPLAPDNLYRNVVRAPERLADQTIRPQSIHGSSGAQSVIEQSPVYNPTSSRAYEASLKSYYEPKNESKSTDSSIATLVVPSVVAAGASRSAPSSPRARSPVLQRDHKVVSRQTQHEADPAKLRRHSHLGQAWGSVRRMVFGYGLQNPLEVLDIRHNRERGSRSKSGTMRLGVSSPGCLSTLNSVPGLICEMQKKDLGPYAYEKEMPRWLYKQLQQGPRIYEYRRRDRNGRIYTDDVVENETAGIVPMLARLSELDSHVTVAYYCHPSTKHIGKIRGEGGFCGYRNIQMQLSYLQGAEAQGVEAFPGRRTPGILQIQDGIEEAWDAGISAISKQEIGRLRGTRKWIGTAEAEAFFTRYGIATDVRLYANKSDGTMAYESLFAQVEAYFKSAVPSDFQQGKRAIQRTLAPPIYLQHPGHSITIVGYERHKNGKAYLVVLDPMYVTSKAMDQLLDAGPRSVKRGKHELLDSYRRGVIDFKTYRYIETLT